MFKQKTLALGANAGIMRAMNAQAHARRPLVFSTLSDVETPISLFSKLNDGESTAFLLESTDSDSRLARYSFIGVDPIQTLHFKQGEAILEDCRLRTREILPLGNPLEILQNVMARTASDFVPPDASIPFAGGWVGYMGYGATQYFDGITMQEADPQDVPEGYYGLYDTIILFDHRYRRILLVSYRTEEEARTFWSTILDRVAAARSLPLLAFNPDELADSDVFDAVDAPFSREAFCELVKKGQAYVQEGQVFQIVLSHRFSLPVQASPLATYRMVQALNPSPYSYFLQCPGFAYLGSSPETFVQVQGIQTQENADHPSSQQLADSKVVLRALAGTRPRGQTEADDQALEADLRSSEKEMAEHRMLVDLGRNDLGRVCEVGSIEVGDVATLTRYTHVMHLATELSGILRKDKTAFDVFRGCFPRGTVTGAPKIRAMQLLSQLEPEQRGIYSGVVGYFDFFGNMDAAIAIRSVLVKDGTAFVNAGAGVVYDSDPDGEYEETRNKARSILKAIQLAEKATSLRIAATVSPSGSPKKKGVPVS
jgi:anthranilate synthase component 1